MKGILNKIKRKGIVTTLALATVLACVFGNTVATAADYHYYDGESENFTVYGETNNSSSTNGSTNAEKQYDVDIIVRRCAYKANNSHITKSYVEGYPTQSKSSWAYTDKNKAPQSFSTSASACTYVPNGWANSESHLHLGSNGVMYYNCKTCGYEKAYFVDFTEYGYYDINGKLILTGFTGYQFCPTCSDPNNTKNVYVKHGYILGDKVGSYRENQIPSDYWHGIYIYKDIVNDVGTPLMTTDPAYLGSNGTYSAEEYWNYLFGKTYTAVSDSRISGTMQRETTNIDGSGNGYFVRYKEGTKFKAAGGNQDLVELYYTPDYMRYGTSNEYGYAVKIADPLSNNTQKETGKHLYKKYNEYINFAYWTYANAMNCIHSTDGYNVYQPAYYQSRSLGVYENGWGFKNRYGKCYAVYQKGYLGICNDCGEMVTCLIYSSPETISSIRRIPNNVNYFYACPYQMGNMTINGKTFYYLHSQIEQHYQIKHICHATSLNQYVLNFQANSPDTTYFSGQDYKVDGYFYNIYEDGRDVKYVPEGASLSYGQSEPTVKSKNKIPTPYWDTNGYQFKNWQVYNGSTWVDLPSNTWQSLVTTIGANNALLNNDRGVINLRATWTIPTRDVKVIDGDSFTANNKNPGSSSVLKTYSGIRLYESKDIAVVSNKSGTVSFNSNSNGSVANPASVSVTARFSNFAGYSGNKGTFDTSVNRYFNGSSTTTTDYIIANYSWDTIILPSISRSKYVLKGWSTKSDGSNIVGTAGSPYTPSGSVTLYAVWKEDAMTINASTNTTPASYTGTSNVSWVYNNWDGNGSLYYVIERKSNNTGEFKSITNGNDIGNDVKLEPVSKSSVTNESYTVQYAGFYKITLKGEAGETVTNGTVTANGGKGGKYVLTMYLDKGDKLSWTVAGTRSGNYAGNKGGAVGDETVYYGKGGSASVLSLTKKGETNPTVVAVAAGGGGGMILNTGDKKDGGNAQASLSENGSIADLSYTSTTSTAYSAVAGGAGGGAYHGSNGKLVAKKNLHTHTAGGGSLVSGYGAALTDTARYTESGGCYTKENAGEETPGLTCTVYYGAQSWHDQHNVTVNHNGILAGDACINNGTYKGYGTSHSSCGAASQHQYGEWICNGCGFYYDSRPAGFGGSSTHTYTGIGPKTYSLNCTGTSNGSGKWEKLTDEAQATGGGSFRHTSLTTSGTFTADNAGSGSIQIESVAIGITNTTSMVDKNTPDITKPNKPTKNNSFEVRYVADGDYTNIYLANINWEVAGDNGTPYEYKGATHKSPNGEFVVATETNAKITVTSGIKHYAYKITKIINGQSTVVKEGTTSDIRLENVYIDQCLTKREDSYSGNIKIEISAVDNAENVSDVYSYTVAFNVPGRKTPSSDRHLPGLLETPTLTVKNEGSKGLYKSGSTYYVKADGATVVELQGTATLNPSAKSRITRVNIGTDYGNGYVVNAFLTNYNLSSTIHGGSVNGLIAMGDWKNQSLSESKVTFSQDFITVGEQSNTVSIFAYAECLGPNNTGCADSNHILKKKGGSVTIVGDKTAPSLTIGSNVYKGEHYDNEVNYSWSDDKVITFSVSDSGSGIASYKVKDDTSTTVKSKTFTSRTTSENNVSFTVTTEGERIYEIEVFDNVGNKTVVKINTKVDKTKPSITDISTGVEAKDVYNQAVPGTSTKGSWDTTNVDTLWEYDWIQSERTISYKAKDSASGMKSLTIYASNASWSKGNAIANGTSSGTFEMNVSYRITTDGTTRYILEAVDNKGNKTTVYIVVRVDQKIPVYSNTYCSVNSNTNFLDGKTIAEATKIVNGTASAESLKTTWEVTWEDKDKNGSKDSSGIASCELVVYDVNDPTNKTKTYTMNVSDWTNAVKTSQGSSTYFLSKLKDKNGKYEERYYKLKFKASVNLFAEETFKQSSVLHWNIVVTDNVGWSYRIEGEDIKNYSVKAVAYATKNNGYNIAYSDGKSSVPYFKTGEVGFVEVWTVGYVEKFELDFGCSSVKVPTEAKNAIANGSLLSKYKLGSKTFGDADRRFVTTMASHKTNSGVSDVGGIPFATHYVYSYDTVNNSAGSNNTSGWLSDGTMFRIPPSYSLVAKKDGNGKPLTDKYGNPLYTWETHSVDVIGYKASGTVSSRCNYVIWDEAGDDLHYRITHENLIGQ